jgi:hypothetical protein
MLKNPKVPLFIITSILFFRQNVSGQENNWFNKHPVDFAFGRALVSMPFTNFFKLPFYPIVSLGTEFYYKKTKKINFFQSVRSNYYYAKYSTSAIVLNSEVGYRYLFNFGLFADGGLGLGYSHLFRPNAIFKQNDNGEYKQVRDWGTPRLMADFFMSLGYDFSRHSALPLSLYVKYGNYADILYAPDIPAFPHNILQIGARYFFKQNN